jgi:hypothetical protein
MGLGSTKIIFLKFYAKNPCTETALFRQGYVRFDLIGVEILFSQNLVMSGIKRTVFLRRFQKCKLTLATKCL